MTYLQWLLITVIGAIMMSAVFLGAIALQVWFAWWLYPAWGWFVVPLGVPSITLWHFIGLFVLLRARLSEPKTEPKETKPKTTADHAGVMLAWAVGPILTWVFLRWLHSGR